MVVTDRRMPAHAFLALPPGGRRTQLIDGEFVVSDPPSIDVAAPFDR